MSTTVKAICGLVHIVAAFVGELRLTMRKKKMTKSNFTATCFLTPMHCKVGL